MIRLRSCYSLNESLIQLNHYINWIQKQKLQYAILVDTNVDAFITFYQMCQKQKIKAIIGFEKKDEFIVFPTTTSSLTTFFALVNDQSQDFSNLIVYNINSQNEFKNAMHVTKKFNHEIYNKISNCRVEKDLLAVKTVLLSEQIYEIDDILITNTNYEIDTSNKLFTYTTDYEKLVALIKQKIKIRKIVLTQVQSKRLNYELQVIKEKNFSSYFLIYAQIIKYLNEQKILYNFGRGSSASSFVCYLLNITKINPLKYDLIFERFLNPSRQNYPDIDLDIDASKVDQVISMLRQKYPNVAQVATFIQLGTKKAQDLINKTYKLPDLILKQLRDENNVANLIKTDENLKYFMNEVKEIEHLIVGKNIHPSAIIISKVDFSNHVPLKNGIISWSYQDIESIGHVKLDLLKLNTLTNIKKVDDLLKKHHLVMPKFNLNDKRIFKMLNDLDTKYIFQLDSNLARAILKKFKINSFDDLAILISLNRPGTLNLVEEIAQNQKKCFSSHNTYNVIIFQEQIIELLKKHYQLSASLADQIRVAISKKDLLKLDNLRKYVNEKGFDPKYLNLASQYAAFTFNKAHAYSYARLVMQILYYKCYFPLLFLLVFSEDNLQNYDLAYLKSKNIVIKGFNLQKDSQVEHNNLHLGLKYLKVDPLIKDFIIKNQVTNFVTLRNKFDNKINNNDVKKLIFSNLFKNTIQTSEKFEIENNDLSSLMRVRKWTKIDNKVDYMYSQKEFNFNQLEVFGYSFNPCFVNDFEVYIEHVQNRNNMVFGSLLCNYGRLDFVSFNQINLSVNQSYSCNFYLSYYNGPINIVITKVIKKI